jgi:UDP-N-acetylglucosamine--N-acetylmuramyl-(pentapeptide) pyrophosphoryl-undecaprenol N-acetylglucosamine transferase
MEYSDNIQRLFEAADVAVCRAGANSFWELIAFRIPHVAVPLPLAVSRGDQIENAQYFESIGASVALAEEHLDPASLVESVSQAHERRAELIEAMGRVQAPRESLQRVLDVIRRTASRRTCASRDSA